MLKQVKKFDLFMNRTVRTLAAVLLVTITMSVTLIFRADSKEINMFGSTVVYAAEGQQAVKVTVNGVDVKFEDQQAITKGGKTLVPVKSVFTQLGWAVSWDKAAKSAILTKDDITIIVPIDKDRFMIKEIGKADRWSDQLDVPAQIINGHTMLPLAAIATATGATVEWVAIENKVKITYEKNLISIPLNDIKLPHLFEDSSNSINIISYTDSGFKVTNLSTSQVTEVESSLSIVGGFHKGNDGNYYVVYGEGNPNEDKNLVVIKVVKYGKDWRILGEVSINAGMINTRTPFRSGTMSMDDKDGVLVIHTSRLLTASVDGRNHQSDLILELNMDSMSLIR